MDNLTICIGQTVELTSPIAGESYQWYKASELIGWTSSFQLNSEGTYTLVVTTNDGCTSQGEFLVSTSSEVLNTEFLMSTSVQVGDTVILIDITHPIPDSVAWNFPANTEILDTTSDYALVVFDEPGIFLIGMEAYLGDCYEQVVSYIEVVEVISDSPGGRIINQNIPMILSFELYPNPNDGIFTISAKLNIAHSIEVQIIHLISNQIVFELSEDQRIEHELNFSLKSLSSGPYAVVISAGEERRVLRMLKN
jgi:hypothetical protein